MHIVTIQDDTYGSHASISVDQGFNLFEFVVPSSHGPLDLLWADPRFAEGAQRSSGSGIPILFPFPGRIRNGQFSWCNRTWQLPLSDGRGNAIHGFVYDRPWKIHSQSNRSIAGEFHAFGDFPELAPCWPADFAIQATYRISGPRLECHYRLTNPSNTDLPYGFGIHPYFRLPIGGCHRDSCIVRLPATMEWDLESLLATGRTRPITAAYQTGVEFGNLQLDNVFGGLMFDHHQCPSEDQCRAEIEDTESHCCTTIQFGHEFRELVVYNPPHREALCIEPYTCVPGATHLDRELHELGWRTISPGSSIDMKLVISAAAKPDRA